MADPQNNMMGPPQPLAAAQDGNQNPQSSNLLWNKSLNRSTQSTNRITMCLLFRHKLFKGLMEACRSKSSKLNYGNFGAKTIRTPLLPENLSNSLTKWCLSTIGPTWWHLTSFRQLCLGSQGLGQHLAWLANHVKEYCRGPRTLDNHPPFLQRGICHRIRWQADPGRIGTHGYAANGKHSWFLRAHQQN